MVFLTTYAIFGVFVLLCGFACLKPDGAARTIITQVCYAMTAVALLGTVLAGGIIFDSPSYLGDLWTAFDAIAKARDGQRASLDYFSPIGPVYAWTFSAALLLIAPSAQAVQLAAVIFAMVTLVLTLTMLRQAMSPLGLAMTCLVAVTVAVSPRGIDSLFAAGEVNVLAPYNRWSWALFVPVVLKACLPVPTRDRIGAIALGIAVTGLVLLKVTYGAAAIGLIGVAAILRPGGWRDARDAALAMILILGTLELATGQISAYAWDVLTATQINADTLRLVKFVAQAGEAVLYALLGVLALMLGLGARSGQAEPQMTGPQCLRPVLLIFAAAGAGCAVLMQNYYLSEAAIYAILPLIGAEWTRLLDRPDPQAKLTLPEMLSKAIVVLVVLAVVRSALIDTGYVVSQRIQLTRHPADPALAETPLADLRVHPRWLWAPQYRCGPVVCRDHRRMVSGLEMLRQAGADRPGAGRILALNFSNPFPILLGTPSPLAVPIWLHVGRSFSKDHHPPIDRAMTNVEYVLSAKLDENATHLWRIYGPYIAENFQEIAENVHWTLFRRRSE